MGIPFGTKMEVIIMVYGYCRVSTPRQNIERQERNIIAAYPKAKDHIYKEAYTGTTLDRPVWNRLKKRLKSGDMVVFDSVSRMSRNADEGVNLYLQLFNEGIELVFLKEPHINTSTYNKALRGAESLSETGNKIADEYIKATRNVLKIIATEQIRLAFEQSQKEVDDLRHRTSEGIETARINGKQIGGIKGKRLNVKKAISAKEIIKKHSKDFGGSLTDSECMALAKISRNTFYKYKRELKA